MADRFSKAVRSRIMSSIKGKNTKPELIIRRILRGTGLRQHPRIFGSPDFGLKSKKIALFVDGCFWHGCPRCYRAPKSNRSFWLRKVNRNKERDRQQNAYLKKNGWRVVRVWEHEVNRNLDRCESKIRARLE
jgi:DNA mismatch endonuclease, patch repair protein